MEPIKVFITEDESIVREGLRDMIPWEQYGFVFAGEASDGETALPMVRRIRPDILITDIKMPFMDGLNLCKRIKEDSILKKLPVAIFSSMINEPLARKCQTVGADAQFAKPDLRSLSDKMVEMIGNSEMWIASVNKHEVL